VADSANIPAPVNPHQFANSALSVPILMDLNLILSDTLLLIYWTLDYEVYVEFINQPGCARRNQVMWQRESSHIGECAQAIY
jgi:hypothetical protein